MKVEDAEEMMPIHLGGLRIFLAITVAAGMSFVGAIDARAAGCGDITDANVKSLCEQLTSTLTTIGSNVSSTTSEVTSTAGTKLKGLANSTKLQTDNIWNTLSVAQGQFIELNDLGPDFWLVIDGALAQVKNQIEFQGVRLNAFLDDGGCSEECDDLRTELITLVTRLESLTNTLVAFQGTGQPFAGSVALPQFPSTNLQLLRDFLQLAPGFALYPLHEILHALVNATGNDYLAELNRTLLRADTSAALLLDIARAPAVLPPTTSARVSSQLAGETDSVCTWWLEQANRATLSVNLADAVVVSGVLRLIGKVLTSLGQTELQEEGQIHGYFGVVLKDNWPKKFGNWLSGLGELLGSLASATHNKMVRCDIEEIRAMQAAFLSNQAQILRNQAYISCVVSAIPRGLPGIQACGD